MTIRGRKSHVKRCLGVSRNGDGTFSEDEGSWLDILRTDEFDYTDSDGQVYRFIIKWSDDTLKEDDEDYDNVAQIKDRETALVKATDPELPFDPDPDDYVPFRTITKLKIIDSDGQGVKYFFKNKNITDDDAPVPIPTSRELAIIRLYHNDTTEDDALNNPDDTHIIPDDRYALEPDTQDKDQYVDMEVIKRWSHTVYADGQVFKVVLQNADVYNAILGINVEEEISPLTNSSGDETIPARMDPFQNILNVQWGGLAVKFLDKAL